MVSLLYLNAAAKEMYPEKICLVGLLAFGQEQLLKEFRIL